MVLCLLQRTTLWCLQMTRKYLGLIQRWGIRNNEYNGISARDRVFLIRMVRMLFHHPGISCKTWFFFVFREGGHLQVWRTPTIPFSTANGRSPTTYFRTGCQLLQTSIGKREEKSMRETASEAGLVFLEKSNIFPCYFYQPHAAWSRSG